MLVYEYVADCIALFCQNTTTFKRAINFEFSTVAVIVFIYGYVSITFLYSLLFLLQESQDLVYVQEVTDLYPHLIILSRAL